VEQTIAHLNALDRFFLDFEGESMPMHIGAVCLFEGAPIGDHRRVTLSRLRAHVDARLSCMPRYRQCLMRSVGNGYPAWVDSQDFRIADHVHSVSLRASSSTVPFEEAVAWIFSNPLTRSRPLWEIWLLEGVPGGGFALVCKTHHCLTGELGVSALLRAILGAKPFSTLEAPLPWSPHPIPRGMRPLEPLAPSRPRDPRSVPGQTPEAIGDGRVARGRRILWWSHPLDDVEKIARRLGGTVHDVALTLLSDAVPGAFPALGTPDNRLRVFCPVGSDSTMPRSISGVGHAVSPMLVDLPMNAPDLGTRWERVVTAARMHHAIRSRTGFPFAANRVDALDETFPPLPAGVAANSEAPTFVMAHMSGPSTPLHLFRQPMTRAWPLVPLVRSQGLGVGLLEYARTLTWGVQVEASRVHEARRLFDALATALGELRHIAEADLPETCGDSAWASVGSAPAPSW